MPYYAHNQDPQAQAFVRRIYAMRNLGVWLLAFPYVSVLVEQGTLHVYGALVALNVLAWPHLAFWLARRAPNPIRAERRNLVADAALGGFWIAVTQVSLVPAAAMLTILAADRLSAGGWKLLGRAMLAGAIIFVVTAWALGWPFQPLASIRTVACALPPIFIYTLVLSHVGHQLAKRIARQNRELDAFSYSVAHDLRAPLRSISGFTAALAEDYAPQLDERANDYIRRVQQNARRMAYESIA